MMPSHHDLEITLERAGRTGDALAAYKTALEVQPGSVIAVREGRSEAALAE